MSSKWKEYEFDVTGSTLRAKVEYLTVNHQPNALKADLLVFLYLKQTNTSAPLVFSKNATIKVSSSGANVTNTWHFTNSEFLSVPSTGEWYKVGASILQGFAYTEKKTILGVVVEKSKCTPTLTISGSVGGVNIYDSRMITFEDLPERKDVARATFVNTKNQTLSVREKSTFTIRLNDSNSYCRIRYYWGNTKGGYDCILNSSDYEVHDTASDYITTLNQSFDSNLNLNLKIDLLHSHTSLSRANEIPNKARDMCAVILETYQGGKYLGNTLFHLYFKVEDEFKPLINDEDINLEVINENEVVKPWNIPLQGYSKAKATCIAHPSITDDNAQIAGYEISFDNGDYSASDELVTNIFQTAGIKTFRFRAFDSRGRSAEITKSLNIYQYFPPEVSFDQLYRCDINGNKADKGEYLFVKPLSLFASCNGNNSVEIKCAWKKVNETAFTEENFADVSFDGTIIAAQLSNISSYDVVLSIEDRLKAGTGTQKPLASGKVLLHFNIGGQSIGIGMYNYDPNTCKVGYDFLLGETDIDDYIKSYVNDFVIEKGKIENGEGVWLQSGESSVNFSGITWRYEKYLSGKVELWGNCYLPNIKPYSVNASYNYVRPEIPKINNKLLVSETTHDLVFVGGDSDSLALISKGGTTGFSSSRFDFLFFRIGTWTQGSVNPVVNFHITAIPKEE